MDCIGAILRYVAGGNTTLDYWFVFVGQGIMSLGQLITWAGPTKLSMVWFPDTQRALATSLASMSNLLGIASAYLLCPYMVPDDQPDKVRQMLLIQMVVTVVLSVLSLIFFRSAPPSVILLLSLPLPLLPSKIPQIIDCFCSLLETRPPQSPPL